MLPLWAKPAAKGAWYQVVSKPVMPVLRRKRKPIVK